jgi:hypothetical protein
LKWLYLPRTNEPNFFWYCPAAARSRPLGPALIGCGLPVLCLIAVQIVAALLQRAADR